MHSEKSMAKRSRTLRTRGRPPCATGGRQLGVALDVQAPVGALARAEHADRAVLLEQPDGAAAARRAGRPSRSPVVGSAPVRSRGAGRPQAAGAAAGRRRRGTPASSAPGHGSSTRAASTWSLRSGCGPRRPGGSSSGASVRGGRRRRRRTSRRPRRSCHAAPANTPGQRRARRASSRGQRGAQVRRRAGAATDHSRTTTSKPAGQLVDRRSSRSRNVPSSTASSRTAVTAATQPLAGHVGGHHAVRVGHGAAGSTARASGAATPPAQVLRADGAAGATSGRRASPHAAQAQASSSASGRGGQPGT